MDLNPGAFDWAQDLRNNALPGQPCSTAFALLFFSPKGLHLYLYAGQYESLTQGKESLLYFNIAIVHISGTSIAA